MGYAPAADLVGSLKKAKVALLAAADPVGDEPALAKALAGTDFVIVQEMFLTASAEKADLVLPVAAIPEREGSLTSGERRAQRFYPAVPAPDGVRPDYTVGVQLGHRLGWEVEGRAAGLVFLRLAQSEPAFAGLSYQALSTAEEQWPIVGRRDLYFGGTTYDNNQGMGTHLQPVLKAGERPAAVAAALDTELMDAGDNLLVLPHTRLFDQGSLVRFSRLLVERVATAELRLNPATAKHFGLAEGVAASLNLNGADASVIVRMDDALPPGAAWLPRRVGVPLWAPAAAQVKVMERD
jgi:NADH-quinone oxidoreductase subunit G